MLTRQYYKAIAEIVKKNTKTLDAPGQGLNTLRCWYLERNEITKDLADYFATDNDLFDRDKFLEACGL